MPPRLLVHQRIDPQLITRIYRHGYTTYTWTVNARRVIDASNVHVVSRLVVQGSSRLFITALIHASAARRRHLPPRTHS